MCSRCGELTFCFLYFFSGLHGHLTQHVPNVACQRPQRAPRSRDGLTRPQRALVHIPFVHYTSLMWVPHIPFVHYTFPL